MNKLYISIRSREPLVLEREHTKYVVDHTRRLQLYQYRLSLCTLGTAMWIDMSKHEMKQAVQE